MFTDIVYLSVSILLYIVVYSNITYMYINMCVVVACWYAT